jgi:hypothetical protein
MHRAMSRLWVMPAPSWVPHAERSEGIAISRVSWIEPSGEVGASVFIPDSSDSLPGIVFSHSAIHGAAANADLLGFAWALARAGATSIVLDGAIEWQTPNDESIRDPTCIGLRRTVATATR